MRKYQMMYRLVLAVLLFLTLVGCTEPTVPPASQIVQTPTVVAAPPATTQPSTSNETPAPAASESSSAIAGAAAISGQVISNTNQEPIKQTVIALAKVHRDPNDPSRAAFALDVANSPATFTDDNGSFRFTGIEPGEYVISVGDFYGTKDIVREPNGDARVYNLEPDKQADAEVVQVRPDVSPGR